MATYAVALTIKNRERFLGAWRALDQKGLATQLDQNIPPHVGLVVHKDSENGLLQPLDFWQSILPEIVQAGLDKVEAVYDYVTPTTGGALLARPIFPNGADAILNTQTAIMQCFGWDAVRQKARKNDGLHTTLCTNVPNGESEDAQRTVYKAWEGAAKIFTGFSAIALYAFDPKAKKFTKLFEYGLGES